MRKSSLLLVIVIILTSCTTFQKPCENIGQVKATLITIEYRDGVDWLEIRKAFGEPDIVFCPEPGLPLSVNARGYEDLVIIFHTRPERYKEEGKIRFKEVVDKIEIGKRK